MGLFRVGRLIARPLALALGMLGAAPLPEPTAVPLAVGSLVRSQFRASGSVVQVEAAVFPRDAVTLHVLDLPLGWPVGQSVRRSIGPGVIAAIDGGFMVGRFFPDGLLVIGGVVRQPARRGLSGVVGSARDGTPVVDGAGAVDPRSLRDGLQSGPFVVDPGGLRGIHRDDGERTRRSLVVESDDRIAFVVTSACGLYDLAAALVDTPQLFGFDRVDRALNLGGDKTSGFAVRLASGEVETQPELLRLRTVLTIEPRTLSSRQP